MSAALEYVHHNLPVFVCGAGVALFPALQLMKRYVPYLNGYAALAANFALAIITVFAITPADHFWTVTAWVHVIEVSGLGAGAHGTWRSLQKQPDPNCNATPSGTPDQQAATNTEPCDSKS